MHRSERRIVWASAAVLAICALGALNSVWPSAVKAHAQALVDDVTSRAPATNTTGAPRASGVAVAGRVETADPAVPAKASSSQHAPVSASAAPAPRPAPLDVTVLTIPFDHDGRLLHVTVRYPSAAGRYPLVVFAHGFAASAATYSQLEERLAASGLVVAAPDFPFASTEARDPLDRADVVNQAGDISAVLDLLEDAAIVSPELARAIAPGPVGVVGHSDGGTSAATVAYNSTVDDPRVGAAAILSGAKAMYPGGWFTGQSPPLLAIHGDADAVNPYASSRQLFDDATGRKFLVTVLGGTHGGPFIGDPVVPRVADLVADFLHAFLTGDSAAASRIDADAGVDGLALTASA